MRLRFILCLILGLILITFLTNAQEIPFGDTPCNAPIHDVTTLCSPSDLSTYSSAADNSFSYTNHLPDTPSCDTPESDMDGWIKFIAISTVTTIRFEDINNDHSLAIYVETDAGNCSAGIEPDLQFLICRDKFRNTFELNTISTEIGATYYIRIRSEGDRMDGNVCVSSPPIEAFCGTIDRPDCDISGPYDSRSDAFNYISGSCETAEAISCNVSCDLEGPVIVATYHQVTASEFGTLGITRLVSSLQECSNSTDFAVNIVATLGVELVVDGQKSYPDGTTQVGGESYYAEWLFLQPFETYTVIFYHNISEACSFNFTCPRFYYPSPTCLQSTFSLPTTQFLCDGDAIGLPQLDVDFTFTDPFETQIGEVQWYAGSNPDLDPIFGENNASFSNNSVCDADPVEEVFAFVGCDLDRDQVRDSWVQVARHRWQVFPEVQAPTVSKLDDSCGYEIVPGCTTDILSETSFDLAQGTDAGQRRITVTNSIENHPCAEETFVLDYAGCPINNCFLVSSFQFPGVDYLCDRSYVTLPKLDQDFVLSDPFEQMKSKVQWFLGPDPEQFSAFDDTGIQSLSGKGDCESDPVRTVYAFVQCDADRDGTADSWTQVARYSYQLFPKLKAPTLMRTDDACRYEISPACSTDQLSETIITRLPGATAGIVEILVEAQDDNHPCGQMTFAIPFEGCPEQACALQSNFVDQPVGSACSRIDSIGLPILGLDFNIDDRFGQQLGDLTWFFGETVDSSFVYQGTFDGSEWEGGCNPSGTQVLTAFVACDKDLDGQRDEWVEVARHEFKYYPRVEAPVILANDCENLLDFSCNWLLDYDTIAFQNIAVQQFEVKAGWGYDHYCQFENILIQKNFCRQGVYFPNAFTPNNDVLNDYFTVMANSEVVHRVISLKILSRWGELMFESTDFLPNVPELGWDGTYLGEKAQLGSYVYMADIEYTNGEVERFDGSVLLLE